MCTLSGMRVTSARARNAPGSATAPINSANAITRASITPEKPNTAIRTPVTTIEMTASVAITAAPCKPAAIRSDNRITPAPTVPPTAAP